MKTTIAILVLFLAAWGCTGDAPTSTAENKTIEKDTTEADTLLVEIPEEVRKAIYGSPVTKDLPGTEMIVGRAFGKFNRNDTFKITTREGKQGYPFYEPIGGVYHYWVEYKGQIIPVKADEIKQYCASL